VKVKTHLHAVPRWSYKSMPPYSANNTTIFNYPSQIYVIFTAIDVLPALSATFYYQRPEENKLSFLLTYSYLFTFFSETVPVLDENPRQ
jgi:hypothetical protein